MCWNEIILLVLMILSGLYCSLHDWKAGIVPNRLIIKASIIATILQIFYIGLNAKEFFTGWLLNMLIADIFSILLYVADIWAAGDVKLFFLLYLCVPGKWIDMGSLSSSIAPFIFIFIPAMVWLIADTIWQIISNAERFTKKIPFWNNIKDAIVVVFAITVFQTIIQVVAPNFSKTNELFISAVMLAFSYVCYHMNWLKGDIPTIICLIAITALSIMGQWKWLVQQWWTYLPIIGLMVFQKIAAVYNYQRIPTGDVKCGMILSAGTIFLLSLSNIKNLPSDYSESMSAKLQDIHISAIKKWEFSKQGEPSIIVVRKIPFAPFVAIGMISWLIFRIVG